MNLLTVVAEMQAKPGKEEALREALLNLIEPTRLEQGCLQYDLHQDNTEPGRFVFFEKWDSAEHLDLHLAKPHLEAFKARADDLLESPVRLLRMTRIG
jgi:quinol monooxygenase YgiN